MPMTLTTTGNLGRLLKQQRERCGLTVSAAAKRVGVTRQTWHCWELGRRYPSASAGHAAAIVKALDIAPVRFLRAVAADAKARYRDVAEMAAP